MNELREGDKPGANRSEPFFQRHGWWLLLLTAALMLLPGITSPLSDVDETRFSGATLEMIQRGEWFVPYFNGEYRFDKPPLTYWLQRLAFSVFGASEFAARLHSMMSAAGVALLIFSFGRRLFSAMSGFIAAFAWLTCMQTQMHGRAAVADMPMIFCVILAHRSLFELLWGTTTPGRYSRWFWVLYLSLAFGFLAKGPVTFAVPLITLLLLRFVLWRKPLPRKSLQLPAGLAVSLGVIAIWAVPALIKTHGLYWQVGIGHHVIGRGGHTFWLKTTPLFYLAAAFFSLAPWIASAMHGAVELRKSWNRERAFLLAWLLGPYLIFSFYATQMPHYVMPAFPAFFLLLFQRAFPASPGSRVEKLWFWTVLAISTLAALSISLPLLRQPFAEEFDKMRVAALWFLGFFLCLQLMVLGWQFARLAWLLPGLLLAAFCSTGFMRTSPQVSPTIALQSIFQRLPHEGDFIGIGYSEATLVYYSRHVWTFENDWERARQRLQLPGVRCAVALRREFKFDGPMIRLLKSGADISRMSPSRDNSETLDTIATDGYQRTRVSGISFERASWVELEVIFKPSP